MTTRTTLNHPARSSILDSTVGELLQQLGSAAPSPGGGAAAALAGALGAALVEMTANLTTGRPRLVAVEDQARAIQMRSAELHGRLAELADADAIAFEQVSAAFKLAHADERQKAIRTEAIQAALHGAAAVPLETARLCVQVLELAEVAAPVLNAAVISDVLVGAVLAEAALESAALNVEVNLLAMTDAPAVDRLSAELALARAGARDRLMRVLSSGRSRFARPARQN